MDKARSSVFLLEIKMAESATRIKYHYKCEKCGAEFIFYVDERDKELDKKLWCMACRKQGGLVRGKKWKIS